MIARATPKTGPRRRLLYIEDHAESIALVEGLFAERKDLLLLRAADINLGMERSGSERPDVILINVDLPGPGHGSRAHSRARRQRQGPGGRLLPGPQQAPAGRAIHGSARLRPGILRRRAVRR